MHKLTAVILITLFNKISLAQEAFADTLPSQQGIQAAINTYHQFINEGAGIYNGVEHPGYFGNYEGFAYYKVDGWQNATIQYDGVVYEHVPAKYDLVKDLVVIKHQTGLSFELYSPRVTYFIISGDRFVYLKEGGNQTMPGTGFYQQLRTGTISVLAKRRKLIVEEIDQLQVRKRVDSLNRYYLVKDGVYYNPRKLKALLTLMDEHRTDARQALRKAKIRFRRTPELAILTAVDIYNQ